MLTGGYSLANTSAVAMSIGEELHVKTWERRDMLPQAMIA